MGEEPSQEVGPRAAVPIEGNAAPASSQRPFRRATDILSLEPRGLNRARAAAYIGVSPSLFDKLVLDGRMPKPKRINSRIVWDRQQLDEAFEVLPDGNDNNPWDEEEDAA